MHSQFFFHTRISYSGAWSLDPGSPSTSGGMDTVGDRVVSCSSGCTLVTGAPSTTSCVSRKCGCEPPPPPPPPPPPSSSFRRLLLLSLVRAPLRLRPRRPGSRQPGAPSDCSCSLRSNSRNRRSVLRNSLILPHESVTTFMAEKVFSKLLESFMSVPRVMRRAGSSAKTSGPAIRYGKRIMSWSKADRKRLSSEKCWKSFM